MSHANRTRARPAVLFLVLLAVVLLAVLAVSLSGGRLAGADDGYEPDATVVKNVETYSKELNHGYDHVLRWMRVLMTFGVVEAMTADQAQENADRYSADRWDPVVEELTALEADDGHEPDATVVKNVETYSKELNHGYDHVLRWIRVLTAFGVVADMSAAEAQGYADRGWERWDPVAAELRKKEAAASEPEPTPAPTPEPEDGATGQDDASGQQGCTGTITLAASRTGPHPPGNDPANPNAPYVAVLSWSYASACGDGGFQIVWKAPGETVPAGFGRMPGATRTFRMGFWPSADAGTHAFRVGVWDQTDLYRLSNEVTVTIPAAATPTPVPTPTPHPGEGGANPYDLRVWTDNDGGLNIDWEAPTLATGRVLTAYVIEYQKSGEAAVTLTLDTGTYRALYTQRRIYGDDIDVGSQYQARVKARHTASDGTNSQDTAWTSWSGLVQAWEEPLKLWFIDNSPNYNLNLARTFMMVATSHANASAVCVINSGRINCPPRTLVSLPVGSPGGIYNISATGEAAGRTGATTPFNGRMKSAPPPPVRVSGGDGSLYVGWHAPHRPSEGQCHPHSGFLEGFKVQYRKKNNNDTWPAWSDGNSVTKGASVGLYRVKSYGGDSASVVWDLQEEGDSLPQANGSSGNYRGVYSSFEDLPLTGNTGGDVALVSSGAFYRWVRAVGTDPHWAVDERPEAHLGHFTSEYAANQDVSARLQYASFISREHTWTGLASGTYQVRVAAVGDGARTNDKGEACHNGQHFHDNGRGFWSQAPGVEVSSSQAPGKVTNPSLERDGGRVAITWDQPSDDGGSISWALIRYRPVGGDPDAYEYTYVPGAPDPTLIGLHFHEVTRICEQEGENWILQDDPEAPSSVKGIRTCTNPRRVEFNVDSGKLYEVGIAAINANGVSDWHNFDHFWHGPN